MPGNFICMPDVFRSNAIRNGRRMSAEQTVRIGNWVRYTYAITTRSIRSRSCVLYLSYVCFKFVIPGARVYSIGRIAYSYVTVVMSSNIDSRITETAAH